MKMMMSSSDMKKLVTSGTLIEASWIWDTLVMEMVFSWKNLMLDQTGNFHDLSMIVYRFVWILFINIVFKMKNILISDEFIQA